MLLYDDSKQMTLGQLVYELDRIEDKTKEVFFDFGYFYPTEFMSWRGSYDLLSLGYTQSNQKSLTVGQLLEMAFKVEGQEFEGYKGGSYYYDMSNRIWVAPYGDSGWTGLSGVDERKDRVILETVYVEYV